MLCLFWGFLSFCDLGWAGGVVGMVLGRCEREHGEPNAVIKFRDLRSKLRSYRVNEILIPT